MPQFATLKQAMHNCALFAPCGALETEYYIRCAQIRTYNPSGWDTHTGKIQPITRK